MQYVAGSTYSHTLVMFPGSTLLFLLYVFALGSLVLAATDYYKTLGLARSADDRDIKKVRNLSTSASTVFQLRLITFMMIGI